MSAIVLPNVFVLKTARCVYNAYTASAKNLYISQSGSARCGLQAAQRAVYPVTQAAAQPAYYATVIQREASRPLALFQDAARLFGCKRSQAIESFLQR